MILDSFESPRKIPLIYLEHILVNILNIDVPLAWIQQKSKLCLKGIPLSRTHWSLGLILVLFEVFYSTNFKTFNNSKSDLTVSNNLYLCI